jgi:glycosyltransferase involved in cell wall biosynthesis
VDTLQLKSDVVLLENISDVELPAIFRNARAFIYCSWAEGFGMPILEAMASGVPVISSETTALSEVCAKAALLVNPDDIEEIRCAICELDQSPGLRETLVQQGLSRVQDFSWDSAAAIVSLIYRRLFRLEDRGV